MIALVIAGILLAVGIPRMQEWMAATRAVSVAEFYAEGMRLARAEALKRNGVSRLSLNDNAKSGQQDWQVDVCIPTPTVPCSDISGEWSTPAAPVSTDPEGANGFKSVFKSADNLPKSSQLALTLRPAGASDVYFTSIGWVNPAIAPSLNRIDIAPASGRTGAFPSSSVVLTLAGVVTKCNPTAALHDSRRCPP